MPGLFDPLTIGPYRLKNRVIMAPLTRSRAGAARVPNALMADYYGQRASAGLIISEATAVTPMGVGYADTPGIWSDEQVAGWKLVTEAVHQAGGLIFLQLWHVGKISDPDFLGGEAPVSASAIAAPGQVALLRPPRPYVTPRALAMTEIPGVVEAFRKGAANAQKAGFDGVHIHGANGYLLTQFLEDGTNHRTDAYGGSIENRARLTLDVVDACIAVWGAGRVGLHISPGSDVHGMSESNPAAVYGHLAREMAKRQIGFLCSREAQGATWLGHDIKRQFGGVYIVNEGFTRDSAEAALAAGEADAVAWGKDFLANPDLPARLAQDAPLNRPRSDLFYAPGAEGYIDYPALSVA